MGGLYTNLIRFMSGFWAGTNLGPTLEYLNFHRYLLPHNGGAEANGSHRCKNCGKMLRSSRRLYSLSSRLNTRMMLTWIPILVNTVAWATQVDPMAALRVE